jgi:signal transduction histidine kinase
MIISPSSEFIALCQLQIKLLTKGLKADWSAVYLTEEIREGGEPHLIPIAVYPQTDSLWKSEARLSILPEVWSRVASSVPLLLGSSSEKMSQANRETEIDFPRSLGDISFGEEQHQIVFPLLDEDRIMGLLVTGRKERQWIDNELNQIEQIAKSVALACLLDRRQAWYQQKLSQQYQIRRLERDRLDSLLHQLRNPLTALRTFGKLLLKRFFPEDRNRSVIQGILRESDRIQELLQEFETDIDATSTQTDAVTLETNAWSLPEAPAVDDTPSHLLGNFLTSETLVVEDVLEPLLISAGAIAQEKGIQLHADLRSKLPSVQANAKALREVLSNLIDNALKYTPVGGTVQIFAGLERTDAIRHWQGIAVCDTGYGISSADREHIFERHYRGVQAQGSIPGTGLGLAIVKELVEQMQGKIELISPNGLSENPILPGTTFIVWLAIADVRN